MASAGMLMGVARCLISQLAEGLVGLWGQVVRACAPLQKVHTWMSLHADEEQPRSLKLLQIILEPMNIRGRPRRSLDWVEAG